MFQVNNLTGTDWIFKTQNLESIPTNHTYAKRVFISSNRGASSNLANNPYHREQIGKMGLHLETMYGCAFRAIFKPTEALVKHNEQHLKILMDSEPLKIGIVIRVNDETFNEKVLTLDKFKEFEHYFECAKEIEESRKKPGQPVLWYLSSASIALRRQAKVKFGSKLVTDVESLIMHPDCSNDQSTCSHDLMNVALMQAAGDIISLAWTDFQIISRTGFGRVGTVLAAGVNHTYLVPREKPCSIENFDPWSDVSSYGAGI